MVHGDRDGALGNLSLSTAASKFNCRTDPYDCNSMQILCNKCDVLFHGTSDFHHTRFAVIRTCPAQDASASSTVSVEPLPAAGSSPMPRVNPYPRKIWSPLIGFNGRCELLLGYVCAVAL